MPSYMNSIHLCPYFGIFIWPPNKQEKYNTKTITAINVNWLSFQQINIYSGSGNDSTKITFFINHSCWIECFIYFYFVTKNDESNANSLSSILVDFWSILDFTLHIAGNCTIKEVPFPGSEFTVIMPLWSYIILDDMDSEKNEN